MGEMIGNIVHQWRQPLSTITTASTGIILQKMGILNIEFFLEVLAKIIYLYNIYLKLLDDFRNF